MPTSTARPPGATASITCRAVFSLPIASNPVSTPSPSVISRTRSTTSPAVALIVCVALKTFCVIELVVAQIAGDDRTAPARRAPCTMLSPTPPQQITNALEPAGTRACRITAPMPVATAASDDRCVGERQVFADLHDLLGRADDLFRESADASHLIDGFAVQFNPRGAVMHPPAWGIVVPNAEYRLPRRAVAAMAAMPK
jgi:hypothetical protein